MAHSTASTVAVVVAVAVAVRVATLIALNIVKYGPHRDLAAGTREERRTHARKRMRRRRTRARWHEGAGRR